MKKVIRNGSVLYQGTLQNKEILFDENEIIEIADQIIGDFEEIDAKGLTVIPGLVDVHVHFREPGREEKETIRTGSMAAAHGGFTSVFAMPNVIPFPDNVETMKSYLELIQKDSVVHTYPYGTITLREEGKTITDLEGLYQLGVKWFSDDGVGMNDQNIMKEALDFTKNHDAIIACHTEDLNYRKQGASVHESAFAEKNGWIGIPDECESVPLINDLVTAKNGGKYHACHISSHQSVDALRQAKLDGVDCSGEVTAHHLLLNNEDVKGTNWKMNPPLRTEQDRQCLIEALEDGTLDFIANDHAPHTEKEKDTTMDKAPFGIVSLETSFPLLYTEFVVNQKRWTLNQLVEWMSYLPAKRFGLKKTGRIEKGWHSDLVLIDLNVNTEIDTSTFLSKGKNTPFDGWNTKCEIVETFVDGKSVYHR